VTRIEDSKSVLLQVIHDGMGDIIAAQWLAAKVISL
jgi:hypothetical protein